MKKNINLIIFLFLITTLTAQNVILEGYTFEDNNRGYLNLVNITVLDKATNAIVAETATNLEGFFSCELPINRDYIVRGLKDIFQTTEVVVSTRGAQAGTKIYTKLKMLRQPGYLFEVTMAEEYNNQEEVDALTDTWIEVYNNTTGEQELNLKHHPSPTFSHTFEQGNHYTIMIRKEGFFTKRMEAYVNVEGCILCFDGISEVKPGVADNLTRGFEMGTLLANVELKRAELNKAIEIENIYYDYNKWNIRSDAAEELEKLISVLKDNPAFIVELGSHTDSRGSDDYNLSLSSKRAKAAVEYIVEKGEIDQNRITYKGYGETQLVNRCANGVKCSDRQHQRNRRTELKIVGFAATNPYADLTLKQIIERGKSFDELLEEIQNQEVIQVNSLDELPPEVKAEIAAQAHQEVYNPSADVKKNDQRKENAPPQSPPNHNNPPKNTATNTPTIIAAPTTPESNNDKGTSKVIITSSRERNENASTNYQGDPFGPIRNTEQPPNEHSATEINPFEGVEVKVNNTSADLKTIPSTYTGYKVEFFVAPTPLKPNHKIFSQHGNIFLQAMPNGSVSYLLGDFVKLIDAENFLNNFILPRYPKARIVPYNNGLRIGK